MRKRACKYFLVLPQLVKRKDIPDSVKVRYQLLLLESYEASGPQYAPIELSNRDIAKLWQCEEDAARACLAHMRDLKLIETHQVGQYRREIRLLLAWRSNGKDSPEEMNAASERTAHLEAQALATLTPAPPIEPAHPEIEGANFSSTLTDLPNNVVVACTDPSFAKNTHQQHISDEGANFSRTLNLLDRVGIAEPNRSRDAALPHMNEIYLLPWAHYAEDHPELGGGYFQLRFENADPAPPAYVQNAECRELEREREISRRAQLQAREQAEIAANNERWEQEEKSWCERANQLPRYRHDEHIRETWKAVLAELKLQMTAAVFASWLLPTVALGWDDATGELVIEVHSSYAREWLLEERLDTTIQRTVTSILGKPTALRYEVRT